MPPFDPARFADTIAAPVTPPGRGGVSMVRVSGRRAREILERVFRPAPATLPAPPGAGPREGPAFVPRARHATLGTVIDPSDGRPVDQALALWFPAPRSYTGEDVAELSFHGSPVLVGHVMEVILAAGARPADPGEFTRRAFVNGRLDLCQAEAVRALTESGTRLQAELARKQMGGETAALVRPLKERLLDLVVRLETLVEFDEDQGGLAVPGDPRAELADLGERFARIERGFRFASLAGSGFTLVLAGRPNAGKSTLFNALLGRERAIVTEFPGTTRDALREDANLFGIPAVLVDTAGIRPPADPVESLSIDRTRQALAEADAVLFVADGSRPWGPDDEHAAEALPDAHRVVALAKSDLPPQLPRETLEKRFPGSRVIAVSSRTGENLAELRLALYRTILPEADLPDEGQGTLTSLRQQACIRGASDALAAGLRAVEAGHSEEYALAHLRRALAALDELTGQTAAADILDRIFSNFCVGK
ncbi:MAG: tRNA uridine-5-carboxymethylaminomethyl(34) synthesis GTPase MnmE [Acidobacteria bacterium]|nr:tRNA uridine-5-carboxymethylaminomethyl(34) synthesis GTPase MnmE [Acidobacteriota bacterium]